MAYDWRKDAEALDRLATKKKVEREKKEKEDRDKGIMKIPPSTAGLNTQEYIDNCDIPGAMDDGVALLLYIIVMVVGAIFNDRWLIWIGATIVYLCHVFRRQIYKSRWDREHKDK